MKRYNQSPIGTVQKTFERKTKGNHFVRFYATKGHSQYWVFIKNGEITMIRKRAYNGKETIVSELPESIENTIKELI